MAAPGLRRRVRSFCGLSCIRLDGICRSVLSSERTGGVCVRATNNRLRLFIDRMFRLNQTRTDRVSAARRFLPSYCNWSVGMIFCIAFGSCNVLFGNR